MSHPRMAASRVADAVFDSARTSFPFGANMAFPLRVLRKWPFDPKLGPRGKSRINGSETELILKLFANGHEGRWVEEARVEHCIQPKQMTTDFIRWYFTGQGASMPARRTAGYAHALGSPSVAVARSDHGGAALSHRQGARTTEGMDSRSQARERRARTTDSARLGLFLAEELTRAAPRET